MTEKLVTFDQTAVVSSFIDAPLDTRNFIGFKNDKTLYDIIAVNNLEPSVLSMILDELLQKGFYDFDIVNYPVVKSEILEEEYAELFKTGKPFITIGEENICFDVNSRVSYLTL